MTSVRICTPISCCRVSPKMISTSCRKRSMANFRGDAFDYPSLHPPEEQSSVCPDATMKSELMALVKTQVRALDFKRNQRSQLCFTASLRRMCTAEFSVPCECCRGTFAQDSARRRQQPFSLHREDRRFTVTRAAEVATALAACSQRKFAPDRARS